MAVLADRSARIKPLEGLKEAFNLTGRNHWPCVGHRQEGPVFCRAGLDLYVPSYDVVPHGIGQQVGDEALDQQGVSVE